MPDVYTPLTQQTKPYIPMGKFVRFPYGIHKCNEFGIVISGTSPVDMDMLNHGLDISRTRNEPAVVVSSYAMDYWYVLNHLNLLDECQFFYPEEGSFILKYNLYAQKQGRLRNRWPTRSEFYGELGIESWEYIALSAQELKRLLKPGPGDDELRQYHRDLRIMRR